MRVGRLVDWAIFEPKVKAAVALKSKGPGGRPRFHPPLMFKVLVLQRLHGLTDDATSFQITDRHSFRAFLGLTPGGTVPDGQPSATSARRSRTREPWRLSLISL
ncbi:MAG: transposase [Verrucomicrobiota bacterium]